MDLMTDENNFELVKERMAELNEAFRDFQTLHDAFHSVLKDEEAIEESSMYFNLVSQQVQQLEENVELWSAGIEASRSLRSFEVKPEDSISNVGSQRGHESVTSRRSLKSNASARAKAAAKRAILEAEAATLKRLHQIEEEELKLRQRKNELKIEIEMAKARAEEDSYAEVEERETFMRLFQEEESKSAQFPVFPPPQHTAIFDEKPILERENPNVVGATGTTPKDASKVIHSGPHRHESTAFKSSQPYRPSDGRMEGNPLTSQRPLNPHAREWHFRVPQEPNFDPVIPRTGQTVLVSPANQASDMQLLLRQQQEAIMALTLPQPNVPIFGGDPIEYCDFIRAFENIIERKTSSPSARLYYLLHYTSGQVQDLVRSCLAMEEYRGYREARKLLAEQYGQPYKIASAYVDRVINGQSIRGEDGAALQKFSILLTSCSNTLREIGYLNRLENPDSL